MGLLSFHPNPNFEKELPVLLKPAVEKTAEAVAATAQQIAPIGGADDPHAGEFQASIHAEGDRVVSDDPAALYIEMGTIDTPPHLTLHTAAEMEGLKVTGR